ncbi:tRNA 2-selenouridine(34) synthase MnmH [Permianibacter sp. IMCC34836]|uniref:tRNA 2-selenouridine(34) synthase MnmH n=1 Tax=Permianibacter fluminis TaxID=2738515 RepID=UPI001556131C|nr:tRNA 2-selenouridine(34) synthase MnmH [Permianibacter fluminis]NQD38819.1 tRNA 2-selenouridine(34) synthase MnmH [Permianibacter fluminis]
MTHHADSIAPQEVLQRLLVRQPHGGDALRGFLDVRSEAEADDGAIPGFFNAPILNNAERHAVGICYKQQGQDAAFALGYQLTAPYRAERVAGWAARAEPAQPLIVSCWRGGARSRLACEWLADVGIETQRVRGGYKAMRAVLRAALEQPPPLLVLSGATGTGKTRLLRELAVAKVDLEACANHRGSAFGRLGPQPSQQSFENRVGLGLLAAAREFLIEDESRLIGVNELPLALKTAMYSAPAVVLDIPLPQRSLLTFEEYVLEPLRAGIDPAALQQRLQAGLDRIQRKLGLQRHGQLSRLLAEAMQDPLDAERHHSWIGPLLAEYYDPRYHHAFAQQPRTVLFRGDHAACAAFLQQRMTAAVG